jgi:phosphoenolpyruvate synthase/pyruvate phosphate dikinase
LVSGKVTGDFYLLNRETGVLVEKEIGDKESIVEYTTFSSKNEKNYILIPTSKEEKLKQVLDNELLQKVYNIGKQIEHIFNKPQDIELVIKDKNIYIVQTRAITTL